MASTFISRTFSGTYNSGTISMWLKRSNIGSQYIFYNESASDSNDYGLIQFDSSDRIEFMTVTNGTHTQKLITNRVFRDTSSFYHFVFSSDTDNSTATNRLRIYVNGEEETSFATDAVGSQGDTNYLFQTSATNKHRLFASSGGSACFSGLATHIHIVPNSQLAPTVFGETDSTSGIWKPKTSPSVTYTAQGAFLKFEDANNLDLDSSGNNLTFTTSGTLTQNIDTPSNVFCVINPLDTYFFENSNFDNGNLTVSGNNSSYTFCTSTLGVSAGKWYMEAKLSAAAGGGTRIGVVGRTSTALSNGLGDRQDEVAHQTNGDLKVNGNTTSSWGSTWTVNDIIGIALDLDNNKIYFSKNGVYQASGNPSTAANGITITGADSTSNGVYRFGFGDNNSTGTCTFQYNFGSGYFGTTAVASANADGNGIGAFEYAVPTGYYAVCTKNIKEFG